MEKYNYYDALYHDIEQYIIDEIDFTEWEDDAEGLEEYLNDTLWSDDGVTGNASGSYYCNAWKAEEAIAHNWDLLEEALDAFGCDHNAIEKGPEYCDVTIRCYLLSGVIADVMEDYRPYCEEKKDIFKMEGVIE